MSDQNTAGNPDIFESKEGRATLSTISTALSAIRRRRAPVPPIFTSDGLLQRTFPYAAPLRNSFASAAAAFEAVEEYNPIDQAITGAVTGPGAITLGLLGFPGVAPAGSDRSALFNALLIDVSVSDNVAKSPITLSVTGRFRNGEAWTVPATQFAWASGPSNTEKIVIFVAEETARGPRLRTGILSTLDYPAQFLGNGAANQVAAWGVTVNVLAAPAGAVVDAAIVTAQHYAFDMLSELFDESVAAEMRTAPGVSNISGFLPPAAANRFGTGLGMVVRR